MGQRISSLIWNHLDKLTLSPTETTVLLSLGFCMDDDLGYCHPRQKQLAKKTHLSITSIKDVLSSLKQKGLILWQTKPAHVNEYTLPFLATELGVSAASSEPEKNDYVHLEKQARIILSYALATLLEDKKRRALAMIDYGLALKRCGFAHGFSRFADIKERTRGLPDPEIHAAILEILKPA